VIDLQRQAHTLPEIAAPDSIFAWMMHRAVSTWKSNIIGCILLAIDSSSSRVFRSPAPLVNFFGRNALLSLSLEVRVTSVHSLFL
jgi:hypothetical protein